MDRLLRLALVSIIMILALVGVSAFAQDAATCPDALAPRLTIGEMGRVTPGDANNVRDQPSRGGTMVGSIPSGDVFTVLDGPVCADGFNWWNVDYNGLTGWTVEATGAEYWTEPYTPPATATPRPPTATPLPPTPVPTALPAVGFTPPYPVINILAAGVQARVIDDAPDGTRFELTIRSAPSRSADPAGQVVAGDIVTVLGEAVDAETYFWREIETAEGERGWVVEGFYQASSQRYDRTLLAACPVTENRIAFFVDPYLYTANQDGSEVCIFDQERFGWGMPPYYPTVLLKSPDRSEILYSAPSLEVENQDLYALSADGLTRRQLTEGSNVSWADWSDDGQRILFTRTLSGQANAQVWTMRPDGTLLSALTEGNTRKQWAVWLDNERVLYVENIGEEEGQLIKAQEYIFHTISVTQGGEREVFRTTLRISHPQLSPDGKTLLIQGWEFKPIEGTDQGEIGDYKTLLLTLESAEVTPIEIQADAPYSSLEWLPDGSELFAYDYDSEAIIRYNVASGEFTQLNLSPEVSGLSLTYTVGWLDDSRLAVLNGGASDEGTDDELVVLDILTGEVTTLIAPME